jgi:tRNA (guanine37-N1)-methyltransferase
MRITVVTLFPEAFESALAASLLGKARAAGLLTVDFVNPRDFTSDRHRSVDDAPYGGGHGMVMKPQPLIEAIESAGPGAHRVLLTPVGAPLDQALVRELAGREHIVLVCGRYEGVDERVSRLAIDQEISLGDFVLSGGEFAALAVIDAVSRLVPGVLGEIASTVEESFSDGASLEYPQYTRPPEFRGLAVPDVLLGGHHEKVREWRRREALRRTAARRPDLLARRRLAAADRALCEGDPVVLPASRTHIVLAHHPVLDRTGAVVTSSITNLDVHDIARSAATYGLAGYEIVTPVLAQQEKIAHIARVWLDELAEEGARAGHGHRGHALAPIRVHASIEAALTAIGGPPLVVATSARAGDRRIGTLDLLRLLAEIPERPLALLFGTGHGLADPVIQSADHVLEPIEGQSDWNHLSVRSAAAVVLDRLFGAGA